MISCPGSFHQLLVHTCTCLHEKISNDEAERRLEAFGMSDGTFFMRRHEDKMTVITVAYKGKAVHRRFEVTDAGTFEFKGKALGGATSLRECVAFLREPQEGIWPVPLREQVPPPAIYDEGAVAAESAPAEEPVALLTTEPESMHENETVEDDASTDQYSSLGRLALVSLLRKADIDYSGSKDVNVLRDLCRTHLDNVPESGDLVDYDNGDVNINGGLSAEDMYAIPPGE